MNKYVIMLRPKYIISLFVIVILFKTFYTVLKRNMDVPKKEIIKLQEELSKTTDNSYIEKLKKQIDELNNKLKKNANIAEKNYAT